MKRLVYRGVTMLLALCLILLAVASCTGGGGEPQLSVKSTNVSLNQKEMRYFLYVGASEMLGAQYDSYQNAKPENFDTRYPDKNAYIFAMLPTESNSKEMLECVLHLAKQVILYGEAALAEGMTLADEDLKIMDKRVADLEDNATSLNMTIEDFLHMYVGRNMTLKDVRSALEKEVLARKYAMSLREKLSADVTTEEACDYRDAHREKFYKTYFASYQLEKENWRTRLENCFDVDRLKTELARCVLELHFDELYRKNLEDGGIADPNGKEHTLNLVWETVCAMLELKNEEEIVFNPHFTATETDSYAKACYEIASNALPTVKEELNKIVSFGVASYVDIDDETKGKKASNLTKWLFSPDRKNGDTNIIRTERFVTQGSEIRSETKYMWVKVTQTMVLDEATWEKDAVAGVVTERLSTWLDEAKETYAYQESYDETEWHTNVMSGVNGVYETESGKFAITYNPSLVSVKITGPDLSMPIPEAETQG